MAKGKSRLTKKTVRKQHFAKLNGYTTSEWCHSVYAMPLQLPVPHGSGPVLSEYSLHRRMPRSPPHQRTMHRYATRCKNWIPTADSCHGHPRRIPWVTGREQIDPGHERLRYNMGGGLCSQRKQEATTVANKLVDEFFFWFGPPEQLHSD